ncbi:MAG: hypothetical protein O3B24_00330 [Verrucomicrobia bacterium]|nr:hypothetical protein [Verrucomicrobiota bacterium]
MRGTALVFPMQRDASFGDLIVQAPFLHGLKHSLGAGRVVVVSPHPFVQLVGAVGLADTVHIIPDRDQAAIREVLKAETPRWAVSLRTSSLRSTWLLRSRHVTTSCGWRNAASRLLLDITVPRVRDEYYALVFGRMLARMGGAIDPVGCLASMAQSDPRDACKPGERRLLCLPGGKVAGKQWGAANYCQLGAQMMQRWPGLRCTVALGPHEASLAAAFPGWEVLRSPTPGRLAALCRSAAGIVANDCGPGHLAQLSGQPCVTLFHHAPVTRDETEYRLRLWWWRRPHARAITTAVSRPLADLPVSVVADALEAAVSDSQLPPSCLRWQT